MNNTGPESSLSTSCYFEELRIRARSPWHREQYNRLLEQARTAGLSVDLARAHAIRAITELTRDPGTQPVADAPHAPQSF